MAWTDKKYLSLNNLPLGDVKTCLMKLVNEFADILKTRYQVAEYEKNEKKYKCFVVNEKKFICPACMFGGTDNAFHNLVIIYSSSIDNFVRNDVDEGGQFFPEDFDSKESMFDAMLEEIEES